MKDRARTPTGGKGSDEASDLQDREVRNLSNVAGVSAGRGVRLGGCVKRIELFGGTRTPGFHWVTWEGEGLSPEEGPTKTAS